MRIVGGKLSGLIFKSPKGYRTHPMSEKARSALFSILGDIEGLRVLDAYSGSGAMGFEAISRGASYVQSVEIDNKAYKMIKSNQESLKIEGASLKVTRANVISWVKNNPDDKFDLIIVDPPFDNLNRKNLETLTTILNDNGTFVLAKPKSARDFKLKVLDLVKSADYGDILLDIYKN